MTYEIIPYTSRTGSGRTLKALKEHGWRLLINAYGVHRTEGFAYALDNGAWSAFKNSEPWQEHKFVQLVERLGRNSDWIVVPDIVAGGRASLKLSEQWLPWVSRYSMPLIAVQDGMRPDDVRAHLGLKCGIFIGGSTVWKLETMPQWSALAARANCYLHVGRVNSARRIKWCSELRVDSFDGTCALYAKHIPMLTRAVRQRTIFTGT